MKNQVVLFDLKALVNRHWK